MILVEFTFIPGTLRTKESDSHICQNGFEAKHIAKKLIEVLDLNQVEITWMTSTTKENIIINKPNKL